MDFSGIDVVDAPEGVHTINEGPMSDMNVIYENGQLVTNATVIYSLNTTSDDYKALYTNGKFNFNGSPLYAFAE